MKPKKQILIPLLLAALAVPVAAQFTAPAVGTQAVTADENGDLLSPSNFFTENTALIAPLAPVQSVAGKSGTVALTKVDVGLGNVDNTADLDKPVSTAVQSALDLKATSAQGALADTATQPTDWDTAAEINAATTDDDFLTLAGAQTITGTKTFNGRPTFEGTVSGAISLGNGSANTDGGIEWITDNQSFYLQPSATPGTYVVTLPSAFGTIALTSDINAANVTAAGALMDSEVTNLAAVKAFDPTDYEPLGVAAADITDATATGQAAITAADAAALRTVAGATAGLFSETEIDATIARASTVESLANTLRMSAFARGGRYCDGTDQAATITHSEYITPHTENWTFGLTVMLPDWTPATANTLAHKADNIDPAISAEGWILRLETSGKLALYLGGNATPIAQTTSAIDSGIAVDYAQIELAIEINRTAESVRFFLGGQVLETVDASTTLTAATDFGGENDLVVFAGSVGWVSDHWYASKVLEISEHAALVRHRDVFRTLKGSKIYEADWSVGDDGWYGTNMARTTSALVDGVSDVLVGTAGANDPAYRLLDLTLLAANTQTRVRGRLRLPSANVDLSSVQIRNGSNPQLSSGAVTLAPDTWTWMYGEGFITDQLNIVIEAKTGVENDVIQAADVIAFEPGIMVFTDYRQAANDLTGNGFAPTYGANTIATETN